MYIGLYFNITLLKNIYLFFTVKDYRSITKSGFQDLTK